MVITRHYVSQCILCIADIDADASANHIKKKKHRGALSRLKEKRHSLTGSQLSLRSQEVTDLRAADDLAPVNPEFVLPGSSKSMNFYGNKVMVMRNRTIAGYYEYAHNDKLTTVSCEQVDYNFYQSLEYACTCAQACSHVCY